MRNQDNQLTIPVKNAASKFSDMKGGHVAICTTEYTKVINWYVDKLDFRIIHEWTAGEFLLAFLAPSNDNEFFIEIFGSNKGEENGNKPVRSGYDHICFHIDDMEKTIGELNKREIPVTRMFDVPAIGKQVAFISDPFGNIIEFAADIRNV